MDWIGNVCEVLLSRHQATKLILNKLHARRQDYRNEQKLEKSLPQSRIINEQLKSLINLNFDVIIFLCSGYKTKLLCHYKDNMLGIFHKRLDKPNS